MQERVTLNLFKDWKFHLGDTQASNIDFDDSGWQNVKIPHDWSIFGPFKQDNPTTARGGFLPAGVGWYRKHIHISNEYIGKRVVIEFGGAFRRTRLWINGHDAAYWANGYVTKCIDISKFIKFGEDNLIAVRLDNSEQPASRYYTGSGLYRDVKIYITEKVFIDDFEPFVTTEICDNGADVKVETKICNLQESDNSIHLELQLFDNCNNPVSTVITDKFILKSESKSNNTTVLHLDSPKLWDTENPYLYKLEVKLVSGETVYDSATVRFGIRSISFDNKNGFLLNSKKVFIKGVCIHHDNGCLGAVANKSAEKRKLETVKEMGCNAIRLSHNPVSQSFLDLCDEMGLLVMDEFFDEWQFPKYMLALIEEGSKDRIMVHNYYKDFDDWYETDLRETIRRDRNHPSIIMYSIGNEIPEQRHCILDGEKTAKILKDIVKQEDTTRPVTCACCFDVLGSEETNFCNLLDVAGYNYAEVLYDSHAKHFPERVIIGSENTSIIPFWKRGEYDYSVLGKINQKMDLEVGESLDSIDKRMMSAEYSMRTHLAHDGVAGMFIWTGIDYLGEPTPYAWPSRSSYFGAADTCCFPKDGYYFYKAFWGDKPVLHLFPHWNHNCNKGEKIDVLAYTNCHSAELFLNGVSQGFIEYNVENGEHLHWSVPYEAGTLYAIGYDEFGKKIAEDKIVTAEKPQSILLASNKDTFNCSDREWCFVTATVLDKNGNIVPYADNIIEFFLNGNAVIEGVDNGDPTYIGSLKSNKIPALSGKCLAVISSDISGKVEICAKSDNLESCSISVEFC